MTSYPASSLIQSPGSLSPVRMAVVDCTMASSAGMEIGKSTSGSISSRLRVRRPSAAKKGAVDQQRPRAQRQHQEQQPALAQRAQVVEDGKERCQNKLHYGDEDHVSQHFTQKQRSGVSLATCGARPEHDCAAHAANSG